MSSEVKAHPENTDPTTCLITIFPVPSHQSDHRYVDTEPQERGLYRNPLVPLARKRILHQSVCPGSAFDPADRPISKGTPSTRDRRVGTSNTRLQGTSPCLLISNPFTLHYPRRLHRSPERDPPPICLACICSPLLLPHLPFPSLSWHLPTSTWLPSPSRSIRASSHANTHCATQLGENGRHGETTAATGRRRR